MNKLISIILSGLLWRKYKFLLISLIVLIVFVFLVGQIHQDYLAYAQSISGAMVGWSFALKWLVWVVALCIFFGANHWVNSRKQKQADKQENNSALQRIIAWKNKPAATNKKQSTDKGQELDSEHITKLDGIATELDPFAELRTKKKLRSYADLIIEKKNHD